jgi:serine/threonine protein kinase
MLALLRMEFGVDRIFPSFCFLFRSCVSQISDFGLVKQLDNTQEMASTFCGTAIYMSPERIMGEPSSFSSDIWSWGTCAFFLSCFVHYAGESRGCSVQRTTFIFCVYHLCI